MGRGVGVKSLMYRVFTGYDSYLFETREEI